MSKNTKSMLFFSITLLLITTVLHADVDLRLNSVDVRTTQVYAGQRIYANFSVTTVTEASASKTFWLDIDVLSNPNDLGSSVYSLSYGSGFLAPEAGETHDNYYLTFELNSAIDPGNYYIHVSLIPASPPDTNPNDNSKSSTGTFKVPSRSSQADVLAIDCRIDNHYLKDRSLSISGSTGYLNNSLSTANAVTVGIYLSLDQVITESDILLASNNVGTLADPYYRTFNFSVPIDPNIPDGNYYAGALISSSNDSNSSNNVSLDGYPVLIGGPAKPKPGALTVYMSPAAVQDTAGWRLVGSDSWLRNGQSITSLTPDIYTVEFRPVAGYFTPAKQTVETRSDRETVISVEYKTNSVQPAIETFEAIPSTVYPGEKARIVWKVSGVDSVNILPAPGLKNQAGSSPIETTQSTVFKLSASNKDGSVNGLANLRVIDNSKIELFTSNSSENSPLHTSEKVKLYWATRGLKDISINADEYSVAASKSYGSSGVMEISLPQSGYVRLFGQRQNDGRSISAETFVHITNLPVFRSIELPSNRVLVGEKVALRWNIPGLQTGRIEPFGISVDQEKGEYYFTANKSMEISFTATNQFGSVSTSRKLRVTRKSTDLALQVTNLKSTYGKNFIPLGDSPILTAELTITNIGRAKARNFFVSMFADDKLVERKLVKTTLRPGKSFEMQLNYMPTSSRAYRMKVVVDSEETVADLDRRSNITEFRIFPSVPDNPQVWIAGVELKHIGMVENKDVVMLNFSIPHFSVRGKHIFFYQAKFFGKNTRGDEEEVARLEGFSDDRYTVRYRRDVSRVLLLEKSALEGRIEITVMNVLDTSGFLDLCRTRSFFINEITFNN